MLHDLVVGKEHGVVHHLLSEVDDVANTEEQSEEDSDDPKARDAHAQHCQHDFTFIRIQQMLCRMT